MELGLRLPQRLGVDLQHDLVEAARTAEAAGYASLWTYERLLFPDTPAEPYAPTRADRGRFLDETLDVFDAVWGPDPVTFRGPRVVIDNASVLPMDLNLQDWFTSTRQMLETAVEIRERAVA